MYLNKFPFLGEKNNVVLSSVFSERFWISLKNLREKYVNTDRKGWLVLGSTSWIKGQEAAVKWCEDNKKEYDVAISALGAKQKTAIRMMANSGWR